MNSCHNCEYDYGCSLCEDCEDNSRFKKKEEHVDYSLHVNENVSSD